MGSDVARNGWRYGRPCGKRFRKRVYPLVILPKGRRCCPETGNIFLSRIRTVMRRFCCPTGLAASTSNVRTGISAGWRFGSCTRKSENGSEKNSMDWCGGLKSRCSKRPGKMGWIFSGIWKFCASKERKCSRSSDSLTACAVSGRKGGSPFIRFEVRPCGPGTGLKLFVLEFVSQIDGQGLPELPETVARGTNLIVEGQLSIYVDREEFKGI